MQACKPSSREVEIEEPRGSQPGSLAKSVSSRPMQNCLKECIPKNDAQCYFLASTLLSNPHSRVHLLAHSLSLSEELIERKSTLLASTWRGPCGLCELRKQPAESQRGQRGHQFHIHPEQPECAWKESPTPENTSVHSLAAASQT